jgi:hypothetical protein
MYSAWLLLALASLPVFLNSLPSTFTPSPPTVTIPVMVLPLYPADSTLPMMRMLLAPLLATCA